MDHRSAAGTQTWIPARAEGLRRLDDFVPRAARAYAATRNFDHGPDARQNVSTLSPYIRARLITEAEVLTAVLRAHSLRGAEKFVSEVFWRTYWKGWLQAHPGAWTRYRVKLDAGLAQLDRDGRERYAAASAGRTGIDAFDAWARELVAGNYLHNHARMWFASIWIFTLGLPWELGADFFLRHLLDGDPASNTLSWRWVAGLHTRGRTYLATRPNIERYTGGRFALDAALARSAAALDDEPFPLRPVPEVPPPPTTTMTAAPALLVIHDDDLLGDLPGLPELCGICAISAVAGRSPQPLAERVTDFVATAAREAVGRIALATGARDLGLVSADGAGFGAPLALAAAACGATDVLAPYAPVGPVRDALDAARAELTARGLGYAEFGRRYDAISWPAATGGFFGLRKRIPAIVAELGLGAG